MEALVSTSYDRDQRRYQLARRGRISIDVDELTEYELQLILRSKVEENVTPVSSHLRRDADRVFVEVLKKIGW